MGNRDGLGDDISPVDCGCIVGWDWQFPARRLATHVRFPNPCLLRTKVLVVSVLSRTRSTQNDPTLNFLNVGKPGIKSFEW